MLLQDPIPALKRQLAAELVRVIEGWTPTEIVNRLFIDQPRISDVRRGRLERISIERLIRWLAELDYRVDVTVSKDRSWIALRRGAGRDRGV
jgi:predicted XRE-type DNA-binding protein